MKIVFLVGLKSTGYGCKGSKFGIGTEFST